MMRPGHRLSLLAACLLAGFAQAEEATPTLGAVTVKGEAPQEMASVGSRTVVTQEKIQTFNNFGMTNAYQAISLEPGVDVRHNDPTGTTASYKIRGRSSRGHAMILEGLPFKGIGIGQPIQDLVDMENIETITIEKGAVPANGRFGFGSLIDMRFMRPAEKLSVTAKQVFGSHDFSKTFARFDTGEIGSGIRAFVSASLTDSDKFKGFGKSLDRENLAFGITGSSSQGVEWEIFGVYNGEERDAYKGLGYAQSTQLGSNWTHDFNRTRMGVAAQDINYYGYNRDDYQTTTILGKLKLPLGQDDSLTFRPYFTNDKGNAWAGSSQTLVNLAPRQNVIVESLLDRNTYGAVLEYERKWQGARLNVGYWHGEHEPPGPPTARKARDTSMNFIGWANLYGVGKRYSYRAPYAAFSKTLDRTVIDVGLKRMSIASAKFISYDTTGVGDVDYEQAKRQASGVLFTLPSNTHTLWLPSVGATHHLNDASSIKASYGRNFDWPEFGWANSAMSYYRTFTVANGLTPAIAEQRLQNLWATRIRPQESDDFDVDYRYSSGRLSFTSALYYKRLKHVGTSVYDPAVRLSYTQNSGEARSYGLELGSSWQLSDNLNLGMAFSYSDTAFTSDIQSGINTVVAAKGKQLPDRPEFHGNVAAVYDLNGYRIAPVVRYLGKRYVDVLNQYSVGATWLADLSVTKDVAMGEGQRLQFSLSAMNLFDKKYISTISTSDVNTNQGAPTYMVGATRSLFAAVRYTY